MEYPVQNLKAPAIRELNDSEVNSVTGAEGPLAPVIVAAATTTTRTQSLSDLGQKLQLQLQEANNIYAR